MTMQNNRIVRALFVASLILAAAANYASAQDKVPAQFQGDWVPATGACTSAVRFRVAESTMTLINGKDTASYGNLGTTATYFGNEYAGISVVFWPELNGGDPPFTVFFNADEKKGVTKVDIYTEMPGPMNAPGRALQAAAKKLAARFPLNKVPLKNARAGEAVTLLRCSANVGAGTPSLSGSQSFTLTWPLALPLIVFSQQGLMFLGL